MVKNQRLVKYMKKKSQYNAKIIKKVFCKSPKKMEQTLK